MKALVFTDTHFGDDTNYTGEKYKGENYINSFGGFFSYFLEKIAIIIQKEGIDLIINLGDLISNKNESCDFENYLLLQDKLKTFGLPIVNAFGNHDLRYLKRGDLIGIIGKNNSYYSFDFGGYHHIVLDGNRPGISFPEDYFFSQEQIYWLEQELIKTKLPTFIYTHFPIDLLQSLDNNYYFSSVPKERVFPIGSEKVKHIIEKSKKVKYVFSGHTHFFSRLEDNGVVYLTLSSFSENDGTGNPNKSYGILDFNENNISFDYLRL